MRGKGRARTGRGISHDISGNEKLKTNVKILKQRPISGQWADHRGEAPFLVEIEV